MKKQFFVCVPLLFLMACGTLQAIGKDERAQYVASCKVFEATVQSLAQLRAQGQFSVEKADQITVIVKEGREYLDQWNADLKAGKVRQDAFAHINQLVSRLQAYKELK